MNAPAIVCEDLCKRYGKVTALSGFGMVAPEGTVHGLLGPNGAGKTTTVRVLATLLCPDSGRAEVAGFDVTSQPDQVRARIGLAGQNAAVDEILSGRQNLVMFGRLYHLPANVARRRADELLGQFGLAGAGSKPVRQYSGGMRRRLDLAASFIVAPRVLFLDEPTAGLDPRGRNEVWESIRALAASGTTVLLTTQYLEEADQLASRVAVIDGGTVIAEGTPSQLKAAVGGTSLAVVLADGSDLTRAISAVQPYARGRVQPDRDGRRLAVPVIAAEGLTTHVVHALAAAGIRVNDVTIQRASLDDVFLSLTGAA